jgi:hypothetical protein
MAEPPTPLFALARIFVDSIDGLDVARFLSGKTSPKQVENYPKTRGKQRWKAC